MQRALVVSIHDVAPATQASVEQILTELVQRGVEACSLLVVPNHHHQGRSLGEANFRSWLQDLAARGHEIVIHGFYHQRLRRAGENIPAKMMTRIYTADEGEFFDLGYDEALRLLREAQDEFAAHGFHPIGFIAPAWLLGAEAQRAVIDAGMEYTTTLRTVLDFAGERVIQSQSLVYSVRSGWRRTCSLLWNKSLFRRLAPNPLLRLGLHPPDWAHPEIRRQIGLLIDEARNDRAAMTYQSWLAQTPTASSLPVTAP